MGIYVKNNNALLLKNDKSLAEFYKGNTKIFGYNNLKQGSVITADNVHPIEHNLKIKLSSDLLTDFSGVNVTRYGKNLFDADTVLPSLENPSYAYAQAHWLKQADGSFYLFNVGILHGYKWFENTSGYKGQVAISITTKLPKITSEQSGLGIYFKYTDGTSESLYVYGCEDYITKKIVSNPNKTVLHIAQSYNYGTEVYLKDIMIAYGTDTEYEPYKSQTVTANKDGMVEGITSLPNMTILTDSNDADITCKYVALE